MSAITGMLPSTVQAQHGPKLVTTNSTDGQTSQQTSSGGDQVTISKEGKELASSSQGSSSSTAKAATNAAVITNSTTKLTASVQDTKSKITSLTNKLDAEKTQAGSADDTKQINARLSDLNTTLAKEKAKLYTA